MGDYTITKLEPYDEYVVECVNYNLGCSYVTVFMGTNAEERARAYRDEQQEKLEKYRNGYRSEGNAGC